MNFWLTLTIGIFLGLMLASWIIYFIFIDWMEVKTMMIRYIFSLKDHLRIKWLKVKLAYLKVIRRLI